VSEGNIVTPYRQTEDAFRAMWTDIDAAKTQVLWQTYICKDDNVGKLSMKKLEDAHGRGVETELLYDCGGNITGRTRLTERLRILGARVIRHRPFFEFTWTYLRSGLRWDQSPAIRNHRKILIVDRKVGYAGGLNIGDDYCGPALGGNGRFRDTHCRVVGPAVDHLLLAYEDTKQPRPWKYSLTRWKQVVRNVVLLRRQQARMQLALQRGGTAVRRIRSLSKSVVQHLRHAAVAAEETYGEVVKSMRTTQATEGVGHEAQTLLQVDQPRRKAFAGGGALRHRLRQASRTVAAQLKKEGMTTAAGKSAMERRMLLVRERAQELLSYQRRRLEMRRVTQANLSRDLRDSDPVPESLVIHHEIPPFTQILLANPHSRDWSIQFALWHVTKNVHRRLWITTPYYMPHRKLTNAILLAARRGVDVRIMAGSRTTTDPWFMWHASRHLSDQFLRAGVRIYEYNGGQIMHAKTAVADSVWSCVGSYNWDIMSNKNMEVCVAHFHADVAQEMERQFLQDVALAHELTLEAYQSRSFLHRVGACCAYHMLRVMEKITFFTYDDPDLMSDLD
jgi:cardiolipin synthase A/B